MTPRARLEALEKALKKAQDAIDQAVADGAASRDIRRLRDELDEIKRQLERMRKLVRSMIPAMLMATLAAEMERLARLSRRMPSPPPSTDGKEPPIAPAPERLDSLIERPIEMPDVDSIASALSTDTADDAANEITGCIMRVEELNDKLKYTQMAYQGLERGHPPDIAAGEVVRALTEEGVLHVTYRNGAKVPIGPYSTMVAKTAQARLVNRSHMAYAEHTGEGVVQMSFHLPTCPICAPRQGRYYRIRDFPPDDERQSLPHISMAFPSWPQYDTVHPNCLHRVYFIAWSMLSEERRREALEGASKPFDDDPQTIAQIRAYHDEQAQKSQRREDLRQYIRYKAVLGEDAPKSFAGFRRMKMANSANYQDLKHSYRLAADMQRMGAGPKEPDIHVLRSLGAQAKPYRIFIPNEGDFLLKEGTEITKIYTFAGYGAKTPLRVAEHLAKQYNVDAQYWRHVRGEAMIDYYGEAKRGEVHWFQHKDVEALIRLTLKRWLK